VIPRESGTITAGKKRYIKALITIVIPARKGRFFLLPENGAAVPSGPRGICMMIKQQPEQFLN
jgi:hypothetical protein